MKRFQILRNTDVSGVSGTGLVAEGVAFEPNGVVLHWLTATPSLEIWGSVEQMIKVHGHEGATVIEWLDQ